VAAVQFRLFSGELLDAYLRAGETRLVLPL
jgi:hypothetical protein